MNVEKALRLGYCELLVSLHVILENRMEKSMDNKIQAGLT